VWCREVVTSAVVELVRLSYLTLERLTESVQSTETVWLIQQSRVR